MGEYMYTCRSKGSSNSLLLLLCITGQRDHGAEGHAVGTPFVICNNDDIVVVYNPVVACQSSTELHPVGETAKEGGGG